MRRQPPLSRQSYQRPQSLKFISLRIKLLVGFSVVFSFVFAGTFYWFYTFATDKTLDRLYQELQTTLMSAAAGVDVEELMALYEEGQPNAAGFSDDPRYQRQLAWFETVHQLQPDTWLYSSILDYSDQNRRIGESVVEPGELETIYLVDLRANYVPDKAVRFLESDIPSLRSRRVLQTGELVKHPKIYTDRWGSWLSASAPLRDDQGNIVAILGLDIEANHVLEIQRTIRRRMLPAFATTYGILFVLIYALSGILTQHLKQLTESAEQVADGNYQKKIILPRQGPFPDEMDQLAQVFEAMTESIRIREQLIRQGKRVEDEIRHALQEEKELNALKSRFISMVSHEFRTPLTVIRTSTELIEQYGHLAPASKRKEYFQRIRTAIRTMTHLMEDVLTIGKAEAGKLALEPTGLNLVKFCQDLTDELQVSLGKLQQIHFLIHGDCPATVNVDPKLLRSILTNLLSNAIKYSSPSSRIEFDLYCSDQAATFQIQDHGIGIPVADQPKLFETFHRAQNAADIRGTGLGLAIVKQCVELHQGKIRFASEEGVGTTFYVEIPLDLALDGEVAHDDATKPNPTNSDC